MSLGAYLIRRLAQIVPLIIGLSLLTFVDPNDEMEIVFQNVNLIAWRKGEHICTVPDLICILSLDDGEPIGTELLRYGLRVAVLACPRREN